MADIRKLIEEYLDEAKLMQLATSDGDQPWVCHVWFAADSDLNIYWFSSSDRRHSHEVMKNRKVAGAIVLPHTPEDKPRGLQLMGEASLLTDESEIRKAIDIYRNRIFSEALISDFMKDEDNPHKFYKIIPKQFVLFDIVNFPDNSRQEYNL